MCEREDEEGDMKKRKKRRPERTTKMESKRTGRLNPMAVPSDFPLLLLVALGMIGGRFWYRC
tara:strand:- start:421 stop:606 length:186 start_codon:yes stop_codon:yes gene_type:complete